VGKTFGNGPFNASDHTRPSLARTDDQQAANMVKINNQVRIPPNDQMGVFNADILEDESICFDSFQTGVPDSQSRIS